MLDQLLESEEEDFELQHRDEIFFLSFYSDLILFVLHILPLRMHHTHLSDT